MSIMPILVPFVVLATGFTTIMILLYRNLQRLDEEAGDAWRRVQEQRTARFDESLRLLDALDEAVCRGRYRRVLGRRGRHAAHRRARLRP